MPMREADGEIRKGGAGAGVRGELIALVPPLTLVCGELPQVVAEMGLFETFLIEYWGKEWCCCRYAGEGYMNSSDIGDWRGETLYGIPKFISWSVGV